MHAAKDAVDAKAACELLALANQRLVTCILIIRTQGNTNTDHTARQHNARISSCLTETSSTLYSTLLFLRIVPCLFARAFCQTSALLLHALAQAHYR